MERGSEGVYVWEGGEISRGGVEGALAVGEGAPFTTWSRRVSAGIAGEGRLWTIVVPWTKLRELFCMGLRAIRTGRVSYPR